MEGTIATRGSYLNQLFLGKIGKGELRTALAREGLLDALVVLYDECCHDQLRRDKHVAAFVEKYKHMMEQVRELRLSITDFDVKDVIGRGHFGDVQVVKEKSTGDVYAMKVLRKADTLSKENVAFFEEERDIMARATNQWLTRLQYAFQDSDNLYLVMEFHPGGDLLSLLSRYEDIFEERMAQFYLAEMVAAIHSLHTLGYVHRDIKPDNILIDRTGHIKLADFGSAAKLSSDKKVFSKMPVGTPDYVSPEVLMSMNNNKGCYGVECDWWSLGIVAYEMLFGKTPFTADSMVETYSNIMNFKSLKIPSAPVVSTHAKDLMQQVLCSADDRLGYEGLGCHQFFNGIEWATLRHTVPPFVPTVTSMEDTSNFDEFDPAPPNLHVDTFMRKGFTGKDLPFIGFTFTKELQDGAKISIGNDASSPVSSSHHKNANLEQRLSTKKRELQDTQEKCQKLEHMQDSASKKLQEMGDSLKTKTSSLKSASAENTALESQLAISASEIANLKRQLDLTRADMITTDKKAMQLMGEVKGMGKKVQELQEEEHKAELDTYQKALSQSELECRMAVQRSLKLEAKLKAKDQECEGAKSQVSALQSKLNKTKEGSRGDVTELQNKLEEMSADAARQIRSLQGKLNQAVADYGMADEEVQQLAQGKMKLQEQLRRAMEMKEDNSEMESHKLGESEECQRLMEQRWMASKERVANLEEEVETKHTLTIDLTKQIGHLQDKIEEFERHVRKLEKALKNKDIQMQQRTEELEHEIRVMKRDNRLLQEKADNVDSPVASKRGIHLREQEATITMLDTQKRVLERQIEEMMATKNDQLQQERKEFKRVEAEHLADLKQEKYFLETQVGKLECDLEQANIVKESLQSHMDKQQDTMSKRNEEYEDEVQKLKTALRSAEESQREAEHNLEHLEENQTCLQEKVQRFQELLSESKQTARDAIQQLQTKYHEAQDELQSMRTKSTLVTSLESRLANMSERSDGLQEEKSDLERRVKSLGDEMGKMKVEKEALEKDLVERKRKCDSQDLNITMLKTTCTMLEEQIEDYERLNDKLEEEKKELDEECESLQVQTETKDAELCQTKQTLQNEKQSKEWLEEKLMESKKNTEETEDSLRSELDMWQQQTDKTKQQATQLADSMADLQKKHAVLEVEMRNLEKKYEEEQEESARMERYLDELSGKLQIAQTSNFKLTQSLEDAIDKAEELKQDKQQLENNMEAMQVNYTNAQVKLKATVAQQTKLIDFLQDKTETPTKKQKKGKLFGGGSSNKQYKETQLLNLPMQYKEMQHALEVEKMKKKELQEQLHKTKSALQAARNEVHAKPYTVDHPPATPQSHRLLSAMTMSPTNQPSPSSLTGPAPSNNKRKPPQTPTMGNKHLKQRMKHNIPHKWGIGLNIRATKCAVCADSVHFGRQAGKCTECRQVCHVKCVDFLPASCGLPTQFVWHYSQAMNDTPSKSPGARAAARSYDEDLTPSGWMKFPRSNKQGWDKKWVALKGNKLCIYDKENIAGQGSPIKEINLCPKDGRMSVHAGVTAAELPNTAATDLPYVLRLDWHPQTTCWPGRSEILMAISFPEKQMWIDAFEKAATGGNDGGDAGSGGGNTAVARRASKLLGNTLLCLEDTNQLDISCTLLLSEETLLIGTEEGLFSMTLLKRSQTLIQLDGLDRVFQMKELPSLGIALMIVESDNILCTVDMGDLKTAVATAHTTETNISYTAIQGIKDCHLFAASVVNGSEYICAAMPNRIVIMKYSQADKKFNVRKEIRTGEPCSCLLFTRTGLLAGTDRFYMIDLERYQPDEFLDSTDTSIAFAVYGASHMQSFPIAAIAVASQGEPVEFLLCFNEFGIFVDANGRRSRDEDLKWSRLPLAFAYEKPHLYVAHFNSMEVCQINEKGDSPSTHTFLDVPSPRCVGPALTSGAIYLASHHDRIVELICLQGNVGSNQDTENEEDELDGVVMEPPKSSVKRNQSSRVQQNSSRKRPMSEDSFNQPPGKLSRTSSIRSTASSISSSFRSTASSFRSTSTKASAYTSKATASLRSTLSRKVSTIRRSPRNTSSSSSTTANSSSSSSEGEGRRKRRRSPEHTFTTPTARPRRNINNAQSYC